MIELTDDNFETTLQTDKLVVVDFWAPWCSSCVFLLPTLEMLSKQFGDEIVFAKMNVDEHSATPIRFGIRSLPTLLFFKDGNLIDEQKGGLPRPELVRLIQKHV